MACVITRGWTRQRATSTGRGLGRKLPKMPAPAGRARAPHDAVTQASWTRDHGMLRLERAGLQARANVKQGHITPTGVVEKKSATPLLTRHAPFAILPWQSLHLDLALTEYSVFRSPAAGPAACWVVLDAMVCAPALMWCSLVGYAGKA